MAEHASVIPVATFAELSSTPGGKPFAFCVENSFLYFWNPTTAAWVEFLNATFVTQRGNHSGTQSADTLTDGSTNKAFLGTERTKLTGVATGATANSSDAALLGRANHTGTQSADSLTDGSTNKAFSAAEKTKLTGIATGATANNTDANLLARANHTGTQLAATVSDFNAAALSAAPPVSQSAFGYSTGSGGTVTQATSKATAVTLNKLCGQITMNAAALAAGVVVTFVFTNSVLAVGDMIAVNHVSGGTIGPYLINARVTGAGAGSISVRNTSAGSLSDAVVIGFVVIKAVTS